MSHGQSVRVPQGFGEAQVEGDGFTRQLEAIKRYADDHDVKIVRTFRDEGVSGTKDLEDRPAFVEMMTASTWASYEELVRLHLKPAFQKIALSKLTPQHVRGFLNERLTSGLSARRVQYLHAVLRTALNTAFKDQLLIRNVAAIVKPPRVVGKEVQPLTPEQARRFLDSIRGNRLEALFTVAISMGLRQGEALGLRWRDVDFEAGTLRIRYALQRLKGPKDAERGKRSGFHLVEPKTKQSRRTIAMPKLTLSALAEHKARQAQERLLAGTAWRARLLICEGASVEVDDLVFVTRFGNPFDAPTITYRFQALLTRAGIGHHRFDDCVTRRQRYWQSKVFTRRQFKPHWVGKISRC
jgi:integrase